MDLNRIPAELDFVGSSIHNVEIKADMVTISNETKKTFGLDIKCSNPLVKGNEKFGKLLMLVEVSLFKEDPEVEPDTFKIVIEGMFKTSSDVNDEKFM